MRKVITLDLQNQEYSELPFKILGSEIELDDLSKFLYSKDKLLIKASVINNQTVTILIDSLNKIQEYIGDTQISNLKIAVFLREFRLEDDYTSALISTLLKDIDSKCDNLIIYEKDILGLKKYSAVADIRKQIWKIGNEYKKKYNIKNIQIPKLKTNSAIYNDLMNLKDSEKLFHSYSCHKDIDFDFTSSFKENKPSDLTVLLVNDFVKYVEQIVFNKNSYDEYLNIKNSSNKRILIVAKANLHKINKEAENIIKMLESDFDKIYIPDFESDEIQNIDLIPKNVELYHTF